MRIDSLSHFVSVAMETVSVHIADLELMYHQHALANADGIALLKAHSAKPSTV